MIQLNLDPKQYRQILTALKKDKKYKKLLSEIDISK